MIRSGGVLVKSPTTLWQGTPATWNGWPNSSAYSSSYATMYRAQPWVASVVDKIANATARLPLKVYREDDSDGRVPVPDHPYAQLLARPNTVHDRFFFWLWTISTLNLYGEVFWGKIRDRGGRPYQLVPLHPTAVRDEDRDGETVWSWDNGRKRIENIPRRDLVHFKLFNPDSLTRGMSPLEPLRSTLENEDGARRANSALWRNGGRPSAVLSHPKTLSQAATDKLSAQWASIHGGVDNWAKAAVLEEGMTATMLPLNVEELQYIEARKLNREEVCARYDVPPPVLHILDHATYSNITEQMRSMYRDTMAPKLGLNESTLKMELRDGRFGQDREPDFGDNVYAEFLMDEVLRGDFEVRATAYQAGINSGWLMPAEVREKENLPFVPGSDELLVNAALISIDAVRQNVTTPQAPAGDLPDNVIPLPMVRTLMGRLSRPASLLDVDADAFVAGLNGQAAYVKQLLADARTAGVSVPEFRERLRALGG